MARSKVFVAHPPPSQSVECVPMKLSNRKCRVDKNAATSSSTTPASSSKAPSSTSEAATSSSEAQEKLDIGAPVDRSLLLSYEFHVASQIWSGADKREPLDVHNHHMSLTKCPLASECQFVRDVVEAAGLTTLALHTHKDVDRALITAFSERWHPDTNTFHLPVGEMTISPDDVHNILGIPLDGRAMGGQFGGSRKFGYDDAILLVTQYLGVSREVADAEMKRTRTIRLEWLRQNYMGSTDADSDVRKRLVARAFLLHLMGCSMLPNKTEDKIGVYYLQCLRNLDQVGSIS